jgi:hypothetical protein
LAELIKENKIYNFCLDFVLPEKSQTIEKLIQKCKSIISYKLVVDTSDLIKELGGVNFIWT